MSKPKPWLDLVPLLMKMFNEEEVRKEPPGILFWPTFPGRQQFPDFVREYNESVLKDAQEA